MSISPLTITEKAMNGIFESFSNDWEDIGDLWSSTSERVATSFKDSFTGDKEFDYERRQDSDGNFTWVLVQRDDNDDSAVVASDWDLTELYANFKIMTCALGDAMTMGTISVLKVVENVDTLLKEIVDFVNKYVGKVRDSVVKYINDVLATFLVWNRIICWIEQLQAFLSDWNNKYGNLSIKDIHPIIADFCILAKECPLFQDFLKYVDKKTDISRKTTNAYTDAKEGFADNLTSATRSSVRFARGLMSDDVKKAFDFMELDNLKSLADGGYVWEWDESIVRNNPELSPEEKAEEIDRLNANANAIKSNSKEYARAILSMGGLFELVQRADSAQNDDDIKGVLAESGYTISNTITDDGEVTEIVDQNGNVCYKNVSESDSDNIFDILDLVNQICSFTLSNLFDYVMRLLQGIMDFFKAYIASIVRAITTIVKKIMGIVRGAINIAISSIPGFDLGTTILKIISFYRDWLKCQSAFCPNAFTQKLVHLGNRLNQLFASKLTIKEVQDGYNEDGTPKYKKVATYEVKDVLSQQLIDPIFDEIDELVEVVEATLVKISTSCQETTEKVITDDTHKKELKRQWKIFLKPSAVMAQELVNTIADERDINESLSSDDSTKRFNSINASIESWMEMNVERIDELIADIPIEKMVNKRLNEKEISRILRNTEEEYNAVMVLLENTYDISKSELVNKHKRYSESVLRDNVGNIKVISKFQLLTSKFRDAFDSKLMGENENDLKSACEAYAIKINQSIDRTMTIDYITFDDEDELAIDDIDSPEELFMLDEIDVPSATKVLLKEHITQVALEYGAVLASTHIEMPISDEEISSMNLSERGESKLNEFVRDKISKAYERLNELTETYEQNILEGKVFNTRYDDGKEWFVYVEGTHIAVDDGIDYFSLKANYNKYMSQAFDSFFAELKGQVTSDTRIQDIQNRDLVMKQDVSSLFERKESVKDVLGETSDDSQTINWDGIVFPSPTVQSSEGSKGANRDSASQLASLNALSSGITFKSQGASREQVKVDTLATTRGMLKS